MIGHTGHCWKTFYFFFLLFSRFLLKDQPLGHIKLTTLVKGGQNLSFHPMCHSRSARRVLRSNSKLSQRCEFTVRSLWSHQGGIWPVPPYLSAAAWSTWRWIRFPNYVRLLHTADPGDESSPPWWCLHPGNMDVVLPIPAPGFIQSWQVGDVGEEALSPPLF